MLGRILFALAVAGLTVAAFVVHDAQLFQRPDLARLIFFHLPCAITSTLFIFAGAYFGFRYLKTHEVHWDIRAIAAQEMAAMMAVVTMITGILFSKVQWGDWWNWDPRQTSFLIVLMIQGAYFALRGAFEDADRKATNSAAYAVASTLPVVFLVFVYPRMPNRFSLHPSNTIVSGGFDTQYRIVNYGLFALILLYCVWSYRQRVRLGLLEAKLDDIDGNLETRRDDSAAPRVVRPVSVPPER